MKSYLTILEELNWPKIFLVSDRQYRAIDGDGLYSVNKIRRDPTGEYSGASAKNAPVVTLRHNLRGKVLLNTIYHEILHLLYPWMRHWKIECMAEILAKGGGRGYYSDKFHHTPDDIGKSRDELLVQIRRQVARFNAAT